MYAKYIDENTVELPPTNYNGISNYCHYEEKLIEDGYLPFVVEEEPTAEKYLKKYRLEDGTIYQYTVADTSDCNNYTEAGDYYLGVGLHDNCPFVEACQFALNVSIYNGVIVQEAIGLDTEQKRFKRTCVDGVWGEWLELGSGSSSGGSEKIGSIISLLASATYTPDGCLPCDGTEYNKSAYNSFYTSYLVSGKLATCTYEEYESDITAYGQCAKFGLDTTNNKFKVPTIKDGSYLTQALSDVEIGKAYNESLPNITGTTKIGSTNYQDGAKVQGDNVRVRFFVVVSNSEELDVPEINQIEFNNPFFFGDYKWSEINIENLSWLKSNGIFQDGSVYTDFYNWILLNKNNQIDSGISVKGSDETYDDYDYVVNETDGTFRLPLNVKGASGSAVAGNGMTLGLYNGTTFAGLKANDTDGLEDSAGLYGSSVGTTNSSGGQMTNLSGIGITTDPTKSGIETSSNGLSLYFYVGETLQKTNVIDISKLQKEVDNLIFNNRKVIAGYVMPDYSAGIAINATSYTAPKAGIVLVNCQHADHASNQVSINGVELYSMYMTGSYANGTLPPFETQVSAGDVITSNQNILKFYPYKGA